MSLTTQPPTKPAQLQTGTLADLQRTNYLVYGKQGDRFYDNWNLFSNQERFMMRALKGIRQQDHEKLRDNLVIAFSWFMALTNRFHIDIDQAVWHRFPYLCSYCGAAPCKCEAKKPTNRPDITPDDSKKPISIRDYQMMFRIIYPPETRTLEHAGIHLAEEQGEMSEALQQYQGSHERHYFDRLASESADYVSCVFGVANSSGINLQKEMTAFYANGCHVCHHIPCTCDYLFIAQFKS
jgi:NTP pyrophosphatase (non-canonical NTP hydrolase)